MFGADLRENLTPVGSVSCGIGDQAAPTLLVKKSGWAQCVTDRKTKVRPFHSCWQDRELPECLATLGMLACGPLQERDHRWSVSERLRREALCPAEDGELLIGMLRIAKEVSSV